MLYYWGSFQNKENNNNFYNWEKLHLNKNDLKGARPAFTSAVTEERHKCLD